LNLTEDLTKRLIRMQKSTPHQDYYQYNNFISFSMSLISKKATVVKEVIAGLHIGEKEVIEYTRALRELNCLSMEDEKLISRITKIKDADSIYEDAIKEIISHLSKLTNRSLKVTPTRARRIKALLSSKEYSIDDFKTLHEYFVKSWGSNIKMKQYLVPETLYNEKFQNRIETSRSHKENLLSYFQEIEILYDAFPEMFEAEIPNKKKTSTPQLMNTINGTNCIEVEIENSSKNIPHSLKISIMHWLEIGYSREIIESTIRKTVEEWSKKRELVSYISISKILDEKFPDRVRVVEKLLQKEQLPMLKESASAVDAWMPNQR